MNNQKLKWIHGVRLKFSRRVKRFKRRGGFKGLSRRAAGSLNRFALALKQKRPAAWVSLCTVLLLLVAVPVLIVSFGRGNAASAGGDGASAEESAFSANKAGSAAPISVDELTPPPTSTPEQNNNLPEGGDNAQATPEPTPTPKPTPAPTPEPVILERGDEDERVTKLQLGLMKSNYMDNDEPTELFGPATEAAVKMFQLRNGYEITGKVTQKLYDLISSGKAPYYMVMVGDEGEDVKELQKRLRELDYISTATGYFGTDTEKAVKKFQERNGLSVDGKIGPETYEALYREDVKANYIEKGEKSEEVKKYQERLIKLGYLVSEADGIFGNSTIAAVKRFQDRNGLVIDGYLGPQTKDALMKADAESNALAYGMRGDDVREVQELLAKYNYLRDSSTTGYFGGVTDGAVRLLQKKHDLKVDGKVGKKTMSLLRSGNVKKADKPVTSSSENSGGSSGSGSSGGSSGGSNNGSSERPSANRLIQIAKSKLGSRYQRGAKGPNKFDCSGFVYWCLNQAGIKQSYMTSRAWRTTNKYERIKSMSDVKKGDILVFNGHVGIAAGGNMMYDASSRNGKVVYRSHNTSYWRGDFICAYRIFD